MASPQDASPYSNLQYLHSWAEPHLPPSINYILSNGLNLLSSLPPSVANIVPLVIGAFVLYWAVMTAISTVKSTLRQSWFLLKWGAIAVAIAYGWAVINGEQPINRNQNPLSALQNGPFGGLVNQAAKYAGFGNNNLNGNGGLNLNTDNLVRGAYNNFVPYPLRMIGNAFGLNADTLSSHGNGKRSTKKERKTREQQEAEEKLANTANVATEWLGGMFEKVNEALQDKKEDRWAESRNRRAANR